MDPDEIGLVLLILGGISALPTMVLLYILLSDDGGTRRFHATPRRTVRETRTDGTVKLSGEASIATPLVAPFSGREVVWYTIVVTETQRSFDGTHVREQVTRHLLEKSRAPFTITDESGASARIVVDEEEVFPTLVNDQVTDQGGKPLPPRLQKALDERGVATRDAEGQPRGLVCIERAITPGETVTVIGPARRVPLAKGEAGGYREAGTELVVGERGPERRMFMMTNGPEGTLTASDRKFTQWTWALTRVTAALLGVGGWLFFG
jgi:hypothetical protein